MLRGNTSTADFFVDGVRDDVQYFRDFYNVDRVEVLRGPNAMIFGRGGGGGIINRVTQAAELQSVRECSGSGDSEGGVRLTGDVDQPLGGALGVRINGVYEDGDSFRRHVDLEALRHQSDGGADGRPRHAHRPLLRIFPRSPHRRPRRAVADGDEPLAGFTRTFFGDPGRQLSREAEREVGDARRSSIEFGEGLTLRNRTIVRRLQEILPEHLRRPASTRRRPERVRSARYNNRNDRQNLFSQTDLIWENRLAGIDQTLLVGFEVGRQKSRNFRNTGTFSGPASSTARSLGDPTVDVDVVLRANARATPTTASRRPSPPLYIQDQIRPAGWLEIVAGLRFDSFKSTSTTSAPRAGRVQPLATICGRRASA